MVAVAQLAEHQIVDLGVVGSSPISHPTELKRARSDLEPATHTLACCSNVSTLSSRVTL